MIESEHTFGTTMIYCDVEGCNYEQEFDGFDGHIMVRDAIKEAKEYGWTMKCVDGEWEHYCPACSDGEGPIKGV